MDEMLSNFVDKILDIHLPEEVSVNGRQYSTRELKPVLEPKIDILTVSTLSGLADLAGASFEGFNTKDFVVQVEDYSSVAVVGKMSTGPWWQRVRLVRAKMTETIGFTFGTFLGHEAFVIGLQSNFVDGDDREMVLKIASNVTNQTVVTSKDDGISQEVGVKQGVHLQDAKEIRRVKLAPYRIFREVEQPISEFVFRARQDRDGEVPKLALFEADGGKWKLDAVENVARKLRVILPEGTIVVA